jgi:hypothetical protein
MMNNFTSIANKLSTGFSLRPKGKKLFPFFIFLLCLVSIKPQYVNAQVAGDYQSVATGSWENIASWETFNGSAWVPATVAPGFFRWYYYDPEFAHDYH